MPDFPTTPNEITPVWLTRILADGAALVGTVTAARLTRIGENESFTGGGLYRIALEFDGASDGMPQTLVAKFSPVDPDLAKYLFPANRREVAFYTRVARQGALPVPRCYFGAVDADQHASLLILQDLQGARSVPFATGLDRDDAGNAIDALAQIHATWWQSPRLADLAGSAILQEFRFAACWARYPALVADLLPDVTLSRGFLDLGNHLVAHRAAIYGDLLDAGPQTCLHRDPQADNLMFTQGGAAVLYDWQMMGKGRGTYDLAYLLISSLAPETRRRDERALVARYHAALRHRGVAGYELDQCWADYLRSVAGKFFVTVVATILFDNGTPHKVAWRRTDLQRLLAFCADHAISPATLDGRVRVGS